MSRFVARRLALQVIQINCPGQVFTIPKQTMPVAQTSDCQGLRVHVAGNTFVFCKILHYKITRQLDDFGFAFCCAESCKCGIPSSVLAEMFSEKSTREIPRDEEGRFFLEFNLQPGFQGAHINWLLQPAFLVRCVMELSRC